MHDIGRVLEMGEELPVPAVTIDGRLAGPLLLGRDLVRDAARERPDVKPELVQLLEHILITLLYPPEQRRAALADDPGGVDRSVCRRPRPENGHVRALLQRDASPGPFTERDPGLGRQLLKGRSV